MSRTVDDVLDDAALLEYRQAHALKRISCKCLRQNRFPSALTLPETQENHRLDGAELQHGIEGRQQVARGEVEQIKAIEGERHRHVVDDCDVDVAGVGAPVTVVVVAAGLQENDDEGHDGFDQAELQRGLLAEPKKADGVGLAGKAASAVETRRPDRLAADLRHDVSFATEVLVAQRQEVVDNESCKGEGKLAVVNQTSPQLTFITVSNGEEVNVDAVGVEEHETDPAVGGVDRDDEEDADNPPLLLWVRVPPQMMVDLLTRDEQRHPHGDARQTLARLRLQEDSVADVRQRIDFQRRGFRRHVFAERQLCSCTVDDVR
jgi:hypothetical protein